MGFLSPLVLLAGAAVLVPLLLHLFHRRVRRRVAFPALRYLQRTEREHARRIRARQLLLLLLRMAVVVLLVLAGARLYLEGEGEAHDPTALAVVMDNSMSAGVVEDDVQALDRLAAVALGGLARATPDDRIWVLRAAEPWDVAVPTGPEEARIRVRETELTWAASDVPAVLARARELVGDAGLPAREIHLLSDLQATAFSEPSSTGDGETPLFVFTPGSRPPTNRSVEEVEVGGGLAPLAGRRTELSARVEGLEEAGADSAALRVVIDGSTRAAATVPVGAAAVFEVGPFDAGVVSGHVETDPDALRADDLRHFTFRVRPPPEVALRGAPSFFLEQALGVLVERDRIRRAEPGTADVLVAVEGRGLAEAGQGLPALVIPPPDPALLPALNRRLAAAGIPWRYAPATREGETSPDEVRIPVALDEVRIRRAYRLELLESPAAPPRVLVRLGDGAPWLVTGRGGSASYLLLGSPLEQDATTLPVSAAMIPLLQWALERWAPGGGGSPEALAGESLSLPGGATHVQGPDGTLHAVDGTLTLRTTGLAGIYRILRGDTVLEEVAVNPPPDESRLERLDPGALEERVGGDLTTVRDSAEWAATVFASRQGPELWRPLLLAALVILILESWIAAAGRPDAGNER